MKSFNTNTLERMSLRDYLTYVGSRYD